MTLETPEEKLAAGLGDAIYRVRDVNMENGWYESDRSFGDDVALLHSEVSEMFEAYRDHGLQDMTSKVEQEYNHTYWDNGHGQSEHSPHCRCPKLPLKTPKPEGVGSEAADILVRLLDTCYRHDIDLAEEFERKLAYNKTRGFRHGGKRI